MKKIPLEGDNRDDGGFKHFLIYLTKIHGRFGWNDKPLTLADFDSKLISIVVQFGDLYPSYSCLMGTRFCLDFLMKNLQLHVTNLSAR